MCPSFIRLVPSVAMKHPTFASERRTPDLGWSVRFPSRSTWFFGPRLGAYQLQYDSHDPFHGVRSFGAVGYKILRRNGEAVAFLSRSSSRYSSSEGAPPPERVRL
eukprot:scaffold348_cov329-Pavlova_lutheri.AAC.54